MLLIHDSFYFFDSDRDAFLASETGAFRSNQNIVFQADASKIFEFFNGIKVQEVCMPGSSVITKPSCKRRPMRREASPNWEEGRISSSYPT